MKAIKKVARRKVSRVRRIATHAAITISEVFGIGALDMVSHSIAPLVNAGVSAFAVIAALAVMIAAWAQE